MIVLNMCEYSLFMTTHSVQIPPHPYSNLQDKDLDRTAPPLTCWGSGVPNQPDFKIS